MKSVGPLVFSSRASLVHPFPQRPGVRFGQDSAGIQKSGQSLVPANMEWLETDGMGAHAGSTVGGANTRRQHGLYVTPAENSLQRKVLLSRVDEKIMLKDGSAADLTTNLYDKQDVRKLKEGSPLLEKFTSYPISTWVYRLPEGKGLLQKQVAFRKDESGLVMGYRLSPAAEGPIELKVRPFVNDRDVEALNPKSWNWKSQQGAQSLSLASEEGGKVFFHWRSDVAGTPKIQFDKGDDWYWNHFYVREADRGLDRTEHTYTPGELTIQLRPGESVSLAVSNRPLPVGGLDISAIAKERAQQLFRYFDMTGLPNTETNQLLVRAADQFILQPGKNADLRVQASYHWLNEKARDTMIALPGLLLSMGRFQEFEKIFGGYTKNIQNGLLPDQIPDVRLAKPQYDNLDGMLWGVKALDAYRKTTLENPKLDDAVRVKAYQFLKEQYAILQDAVTHFIYGRHSGQELLAVNSGLSVIVNHEQGRLPVGTPDHNGLGVHGIGMETDGLITADSGALTWMDARDAEKDGSGSNQLVTPRSGKAVEINALWYNALMSMADLAKSLKTFQRAHNPENIPGQQIQKFETTCTREIGQYEALARIVKEGMQKFWNPDRACLNDLIDTSNRTGANQVRPNQVLALSLPHRAFTSYQEKAILKTVEEQLLTPYGLRSLSARDPEYKAFYPIGGPQERNRAYHQGTVFSWLIGPYIDAYLNVHGNAYDTRQQARKLLLPLLDHAAGKIPEHLESGAVKGGISEIFDGHPPHFAKGAVSQATSVAEVLRQQIFLSKYPD